MNLIFNNLSNRFLISNSTTKTLPKITNIYAGFGNYLINYLFIY